MKNATLMIALAVGMLTGCNSDDVFDVHLDGVDGRTGIQLINASAQQLDYHIASFKGNGDAPDIKAQKFRPGSLEAGQDPSLLRSRPAAANYR